MNLFYAIGFTEQHLFGYDSSLEESHHAYKQALNDNCDKIEVEVAGQRFNTSPTMAKQAYQFQSTAMTLARNGAEVVVHGSGLLPAIHQEMQKPIAANDLEGLEARKYCNMWAFNEYRKFSPGEEYVPLASQYLTPGCSVIDFGCGTGRPAQKLKDMGYQVLGIDHAGNCLDENVDISFLLCTLWSLPELSADFGFCTDVMEHIPPEKVDDVLANIARCVPQCFFAIHTDHDGMGQWIEDTLHMTVQDKSWWEAKIRNHFPCTTRLDDDHSAVFLGARNV
jgi:hypothetical protein